MSRFTLLSFLAIRKNWNTFTRHFATREVFAAHWVEDYPGREARAALVEWLLARFADSDTQVTVYFDGPAALVEARSASVCVVYSGGEGSQRADAAILQHLARLAAADAPTAVTVVTRDLKLARRARKRGAVVVEPRVFCPPPDVSEGRSAPAPVPPAGPE